MPRRSVERSSTYNAILSAPLYHRVSSSCMCLEGLHGHSWRERRFAFLVLLPFCPSIMTVLALSHAYELQV